MRRLGLATEKLRKELDILHFVRDIRLLELLKRTGLNRRQRLSVPYFRRYTIRNKEIASDSRLFSYKSRTVPYDGPRKTTPVESLIESFDPHDDPVDRRIFFEITGLRLDDHDYRDESPNEDDDGL